MRKFTVENTVDGWVARGVRGNVISGPHAEEWMAHLYGTHAACAPSLMKRLNLKKRNGLVSGRPFGGVEVKALLKRDGDWAAIVVVDGDVRNYIATKRDDVLKMIEAHGRDIVKTRNMLNPEAGEIDIYRSEWGGCTDPGTERYHSM